MATEGRHTELWIGVIVLIAVLILVPGMFLFTGIGTGMMGGGGTMGWAPFGIGMVIVVVLIVVVLAFTQRSETGAWPPYPYAPYAAPPPPAANLTPVQILDARYARGDITRDEYLRMRQDLEARKP